MATYYVSKSGDDKNDGGEQTPFLTISRAASVAVAGDCVVVGGGEYREWVKPRHGGLSNTRRVTYTAAAGERPVIKGSERVQTWEGAGGTVWKAVLDNSVFGGWNPYAQTIVGDWLVCPNPKERVVHLGDVYLNGKSFYEAENLDGVVNAGVTETVLDNWTNETVPAHEPEQTKYRWYAEVSDAHTTIYANFHGANPNEELAEVNVRRSCFYPAVTGVGYITLRGFEICHAATPWAPPTGDQPGMVGPNWSKGWIIEGCVLHDSKCAAISLGKEASTGDNYRTFRRDKPGYQYQLESVFAAYKIGWSKENIGSHVVRGNVMYDCGQNGVVGHLGCVFSEIYDNHIYNIALKREFYGHEIAGIKLHAAIDVLIKNNHIHDCSLGTWLDWQAQGARVSANLYYNNNRDLFIEVTHGPHLVDNNVFGSKYCLDNHAQGGAYIHNVFAGKISPKKMLNRATPYHAQHSTDVTGYAMVYGWDDRLYGNIFVGGRTDAPVGTSIYDGCPASLEEYVEKVNAGGVGDLNLFEGAEQPAYINANCYLDGAKPFGRETAKLCRPEFESGLRVSTADGGVWLEINLPEGFDGLKCPAQGTATLGRVRIVDQEFENPDGTPLTVDADFFGERRSEASVCGPFAALRPGANRLCVAGV